MAHLTRIVDAYKERGDDLAPVTIGHPKDNSPKFASIERVELEGDMLVAYAKDLHPEFERALNEKLYDKVSGAFTGDRLRHIGFLGGTPPAIKALPSFSFKSDEEYTEVEFAVDDFPDRWMWRSLKRVMQGLRDWIIETNDIETADRIIPQWNIEDMDPPDPPNTNNQFSHNQETDDMKTVEQLQQELAARDAKIAELEAVRAAEAKAQRTASINAFCESDAVKKKLNPQNRVFVAEFMSAIDGEDLRARGEARAGADASRAVVGRG